MDQAWDPRGALARRIGLAMRQGDTAAGGGGVLGAWVKLTELLNVLKGEMAS